MLIKGDGISQVFKWEINFILEKNAPLNFQYGKRKNRWTKSFVTVMYMKNKTAVCPICKLFAGILTLGVSPQ